MQGSHLISGYHFCKSAYMCMQKTFTSTFMNYLALVLPRDIGREGIELQQAG